MHFKAAEDGIPDRDLQQIANLSVKQMSWTSIAG